MKKILLVLLALFSLVGLTACNNVKAKELKIDGSKADEDDLEDFMDELEEYYEDNEGVELENQWYSLSYYRNDKIDEIGEKEDYKRTVEATGSYYFSKFAYETKIKITATVSETYLEDDEKVENKIEITYIYKEGKSYCKTVEHKETENGKGKEVSYTSEAPEEFSKILNLEALMFNVYAELEDYALEGDFYQNKNGFSGELEFDEDDYEGISQLKYEYDKKTYQLKSYEVYSNLETDESETVSYTKIDTKKFGFISAPKNPEKYN